MAWKPFRDIQNGLDLIEGQLRGAGETIQDDPVLFARAMFDPTGASQLEFALRSTANNPELTPEQAGAIGDAVATGLAFASAYEREAYLQELRAAWITYTDLRRGLAADGADAHERAYLSAYGPIGSLAPTSDEVLTVWTLSVQGVQGLDVPGSAELLGRSRPDPVALTQDGGRPVSPPPPPPPPPSVDVSTDVRLRPEAATAANDGFALAAGLLLLLLLAG